MELVNTVADGLVVGLDYSLFVDGEMIDSSGMEPLEYLQGYNNIIPGLEKQLNGMVIGESKEVRVAPSEAYGEYDPDAIYDLPKNQFPPTFNLEVGSPLRVRTDGGQVVNARITEVGAETVKIDLNHPLAGKELFFRAKIVSLRPGTDEELANGRLGGGCSTCGSSSGCGGSCN